MRPKSSLINGVFNSVFSDESDTTETISSTPLLDISPYKNSRNSRNSLDLGSFDWENVKLQHTKGSLIMKTPFKVRTKKQKELSFIDILNTFEIDFEESKKNKNKYIDSCIPQLMPDSVFYFLNNDFVIYKQKLVCEYKELINK